MGNVLRVLSVEKYLDNHAKRSTKSNCDESCQKRTVQIQGGSMFEGLFQPMHLLVIFGIALLVFGPRKLPELGKGIGEGIRGFKAAINDQEKPTSKTTIVSNDQIITKV
jgi:sec-independent protein translocase protein TatA